MKRYNIESPLVLFFQRTAGAIGGSC